MKEDTELLRSFAMHGSQADFTALVERRIGLVYSIALRQMNGNAQLAEEVAQEVLVRLARQARALSSHPALAGWLHRTTQFVAIDVLRKEERRRSRENEIATMSDTQTAPSSTGQDLGCALDRILANLGEVDRNVLILHFFHDLPFREIAGKLRLSEDAARKRTERALNRIRSALARRGIASTSAALAMSLSTQAIGAAPAGLAAKLAAVALAAPATTGALAAVTISFMSTMKTTTVAATIIAMAAIGFGIAQRAQSKAASHEAEILRQERDALAARLVRAEQGAQLLDVEAPTATPAPATVFAATAVDLPTLEETKAVLSRVVSRIGQVSLDSRHIANIQAWMKKDPSALLQWITALPTSKQQEHTLEAIIATMTEPDPELAFILTGGIEREVPRRNRRHTVLRAWADRDPDAAARAVAAADLPESERTRFNNLIKYAKISRESAR